MANIFELNINLNTIEKTEAEKALDETTNGSAEPTSEPEDNPADKAKGNLKKLGAVAAIEGVKQISSGYISNYSTNLSTFYGDQARANEVSNLMATTNTLSSIGQMALTGASIGGAWGAIIGAAIGAIGKVVDIVVANTQYNKLQVNHVLDSNYAQERLGILTTSKGR